MHIFFKLYEINRIINKFLWAGNKFMPEMDLRHPRFTCRACVTFSINKEIVKKN